MSEGEAGALGGGGSFSAGAGRADASAATAVRTALGARGLRGRGRLGARAQRDDRRPLRGDVADLQQHLGDDAAKRRRHVHRRLVGLQRDERVVLGDLVALGNMDFNNGDVGEVADVGDRHLLQIRHGASVSGSMPYFSIAALASSSRPSACSAATATWWRSTSKNRRKALR